VLDPNPRIGFLAQARALAAAPATSATGQLIFNNRLDAALTAILVIMVSLVVIESVRVWAGILSGKKASSVREAPFVMTRLVAGDNA
jgi:carbon starvation protein